MGLLLRLASTALQCVRSLPLLPVLVAGALVPPVQADDISPAQIKAAFVLNIARFVSWPAERNSAAEFVFCNYRRDVLGEAFSLLQGSRLGGRPVQRRTVQRWQDSQGCDLLLVPADALLAFKLEAAASPSRSATLVVADLTGVESRGQVHTGVHIALVRQGARMAFEVHLAGLQQSGLKASSELLKLARIVRENG